MFLILSERYIVMAKQDQKMGRHVFAFNPKDNGGEQLILVTDFIANGDPDGVFMNQEIGLNSYCNSASFNLCGAVLSPETLRELANQLESEMIKARLKTREVVVEQLTADQKLSKIKDMIEVAEDTDVILNIAELVGADTRKK